jgi:hypothetical protein
VDAKAFLTENGVKFDAPDATATYNSRTKTLTVINTPDQLDLVAGIVDDSEGVNPVQVDIQAKFVEFTQSNVDELSFDWLLGQSNVRGSKSIFTAGGTPGSARSQINPADYPFVIPSNGAFNNGGQPVGVYPVTAGNRSGGMALSSNAIDALLMGVATFDEAIHLDETSRLHLLTCGLQETRPGSALDLVLQALAQTYVVEILDVPSLSEGDLAAGLARDVDVTVLACPGSASDPASSAAYRDLKAAGAGTIFAFSHETAAQSRRDRPALYQRPSIHLMSGMTGSTQASPTTT